MLNSTPSTVAHIRNELSKTIVGQDDAIVLSFVMGMLSRRVLYEAMELRVPSKP